jgi:hypothetical protein
MSGTSRHLAWPGLCALLVGCMALEEPNQAPAPLASEPADMDGYGRFGGREKAEVLDAYAEEEAMDDGEAIAAPARLAVIRGAEGRARRQEGEKKRPAAKDAGEQARIREWFPEAFLWQPSVATDADGTAHLDVRVPDQLTTWRILALAHARNGQQAGAVETFDTRMPVSVDPVVPDWLYVGDVVRTPAQVVSMGDPFVGRAEVRASGSLSGLGGGAVSLSSGGSRVVWTGLTAEQSGSGSVTAELFAGDRVDGAERVVSVLPAGRPVTKQVGGGLSGPRTLGLDDPDASEQRIVVQVFPGPLAVFQSELERVGDSPPGAYGYALIDGIRTLSESAGVEIDEPGLRRLRIRSWQRIVRQGRSPDLATATELLLGLQNPTDPLSEGMRDRMVRTIESNQRGDGTWASDARSTLQQVLVQTAATSLAMPDTASGAQIRAQGAIERNLPSIDDPYTAAWVLAADLVGPSMRPKLQERVLEGITERGDGSRRWSTSGGSLRNPLGRSPSRAEMLAVASLALADRDDLDWRADLVSELLQSWSADRGFGAGALDPVVLKAVREGLGTIDGPVAIAVAIDGEQVASGAVDPSQPHLPAVLEAMRGGKMTVSAEPPVPGLAFVATHTAWKPFTGAEALPGVEVEVASGPLVAGRTGALTLTAAAPSGVTLEIVQGVPAGTAVEVPADVRSLLTEHRVEADRVVLKTRAFGAGEIMDLRLDVTPQYAGRMSTRPLELKAAGSEAQLAPFVWTVQSGVEGS